ncbi:hypothetical protein [Allonocardiopsis opalescens]|uniref:Uncharacterized protein n=1 Tax=Allonocardiopsis opalescens TaxID=1144618 RepID=A0A2T0PX03_9ACTN|nr:hypothetical protein [Allonocardiopsis opalescens]PRX96070.1 hypothetical protein CLV72_10874 [Allonocardiopsis opalescens]
MGGGSRLRAASDRGSAAVQYGGLIVLAGLIAAALIAGLGQLGPSVGSGLQQLFGGPGGLGPETVDCARGDGPDSGGGCPPENGFPVPESRPSACPRGGIPESGQITDPYEGCERPTVAPDRPELCTQEQRIGPDGTVYNGCGDPVGRIDPWPPAELGED